MSELIERAKTARQEMIDEDVNGWPNTIQDLIDCIEEQERRLVALSRDFAGSHGVWLGPPCKENESSPAGQ